MVEHAALTVDNGSNVQARLRQAAEVLRRADALLITTGAGMGADSGLGTFRGRGAGVWPPLRALGIDYSTICRPSWFTKDPRLAWAYWQFCHELYSKTEPHTGYELLAKWGHRCEMGFFSVTSNIDGHWRRTSGVGADRIYEIHGSVMHMQCVEFDGRTWLVDRAQIQSLVVPAWDLEAGDSIEMLDHRSEWVPAVVGQDGVTICSLDGTAIRARGVRCPGGLDLLRVSDESSLPSCPHTGKPARPNVVMFEDHSVCMRRIDDQSLAFDAWERNLSRDAHLVIVEVGAGKAIPTIRGISEKFVDRFPNSTLVRLNLDDSDVPQHLVDRSVSVGGLGALEACLAIDGMLND